MEWLLDHDTGNGISCMDRRMRTRCGFFSFSFQVYVDAYGEGDGSKSREHMILIMECIGGFPNKT